MIHPSSDDEISHQLLVKHIYMYEIGRELLSSGKKEEMYYQIKILESEIEKAVLKNGNIVIDKTDIDNAIGNLVVEKYFDLKSGDEEKKTMYITVSAKGLSAITSAYFYQMYENRQRDLLQLKLTASTLSMNYWMKIFTGILAISAFFTLIGEGYRIYKESNKSETQEERDISQMKSSLNQTETYLKKMSDSILVRVK